MEPQFLSPEDPKLQQSYQKKRSQDKLKEQLRNRLYDKGVNPEKMPSIKRPNSESLRPFTAKLPSRMTKGKSAKRPAQEKDFVQVPSATLVSERDLSIEEQKSHRQMGTRPFDTLVPAAAHGISKDKSKKSYGDLGGAFNLYSGPREGLDFAATARKSGLGTTLVRSITGVTTMGALAPSRKIKSRKDIMTTRALGGESIANRLSAIASKEKLAATSSGNLAEGLLSKKKKLGEEIESIQVNEPIFDAHEIEDYMRTQELVMKMTGKLPQPVPMKDIAAHGVASKKRPKTQHKRIYAKEVKKQMPILDANSVEACIKRIQEASDKEGNEGAFVYLKQKKEEEPYDLEYCQYTAVEKLGGRFYTLSKKGFTSYFRGEAAEFLTIVEWIMERELYEQIKSFTFFKLFKSWKIINLWRKNVISERRKSMKEKLGRIVIFSKPEFAQLLIMHRMHCRELEQQRLIDLSEPDDSLSLKQFEAMQDAYMKKVANKITEISNKSKLKFKEVIQHTLDDLKKKIREQQQVNEKARESRQQANSPFGQTARNLMQGQNQPEGGKPLAIDAVYEHLGFQSNLLYADRTEVRKECKMFLRFSYLLDFIAKNSLKNMYINSMQALHKYLSQRNDIVVPINELPVLKIGQDYTAERSSKPIVQINVDLTDNLSVKEENIKYEYVDVYEKPPIGKINEHNFDPTCHMQLVERKGDDENKIILGEKVRRSLVNNITTLWLNLKPSYGQITEALYTCVENALLIIKNYERKSKSEMLHPYASVLEEWDDKVADVWEIAEEKHLSCLDILNEENEYKDRKLIVEEHAKKIQENSDKYLKLVEPYLQLYWRYQRIPWSYIEDEKLKEPVDIVTLFVKQIRAHKEEFFTRLAVRVDLGFIRLHMGKLRERLINVTLDSQKQLDNIMPLYLSNECDKVKSWLEMSKHKVQFEIKSAINFVEQTRAIKLVEAKMDQYINKLELIREMFALCKTYEIRSPKEEIYNELMQLLKELSNAMHDEANKGERRKEEFKAELKKMIEKVKISADQLSKDVNNPALLERNPNSDSVLQKLLDLKDRCDSIRELADQCIQVQQVLEMEPGNFDFVEDVKSEIDIRIELWTSLREFKMLVERWGQQKFCEIETNDIASKAEFHTKIALRCENRGLKDSPVVQDLKAQVIQFRETMPVVEALGNKKLKTIHWEEIKDVLRTDIDLQAKEFTLDALISLNAAKHKDEIHNISVTAAQEFYLEEKLEEIKKQWEKKPFQTKLYTKEAQRDQITIIAESDNLFIELEDTLTALNTIIGSRYVRRLQDKAYSIKASFDLVWLVVDEWIRCQRNWLYLDSIFSSADIRLHLKNETANFEFVDKAWRPMMRTITIQSKNVIFNYANNEHLGKLQKLNKSMDKIKKELQNYLETKRKEFPRFYFLSDGELLPVMSKSSDITSVEPIMPKCFDGIARLDLGNAKPYLEIFGMYSAEDEWVKFKGIKIRSDETVVTWLQQVELQMREKLRQLIKTGYQDHFLPGTERKAWVMSHFAQIVSCVTQLVWTEGCEVFIKEMAEDDTALIELLQQSIEIINQSIEVIRGDLTPLERSKIIALITTDVHWRDIIEKLATESVSSLQDFLWQVQLRYYFDDSQDSEGIKIMQVNSEISYGYEYMGAASRLVVTPLTERCYLTITSALHIHLGAAPAGPAGTGKTETVKDLSKACAIQCIVFNCSEQMEIKIMARLFSGLIQQGAWSCLDEFNRIDIEVLSVIAQQLLMIRDALREGKTEIVLNEIEMSVKESVGVFITMNPNYAGRTELPDNLKILFRPIAMMIPDYSLIAEILLFAQGFQNAKNLALKMTQLYKLASEQLSQQEHYDFGMRAIKSVLVIAGSLKKMEPTLSEDVLLIRAMRDANVPKFLADDLQLFLQLIQDLFPGMDIPETVYGSLTEEINSSLERLDYKPGKMFVSKVTQLFESLNVRFGVMVLGQPGVGKSACIKVLQDSMNHLKMKNIKDPRFQNVETKIIFPKAISLGELYGEESKDTKEWKYGIASKLMKKAAAETQKKRAEHMQPSLVSKPSGDPEDRTWILMDGPVDSKWIENMNSVLDDSRMLCLANAERIKLPTQMRILFEVQDLTCASLATVSRCGMVYICPSDVGWKAFIDSWVAKTSRTSEIFKAHEELRHLLNEMVEECVEKVVNTIEKLRDAHAIQVDSIQCLESFINFMNFWISKISPADSLDTKKRKLMAYFAFSLVWSFGGFIINRNQASFDEVVRPMFPKLSIPYSGTIFDYKMELTESNTIRWKHWREFVPQFKFSLNQSYFNLFVPTSDSVKYSYIMALAVEMLRPAFFIGETGVGKSVMMQHLLMKKQAENEITVTNIVFSATTSSIETQSSIEVKMEAKKGKKLLGPPGNTKGIIFVDDVNMPVREESGAQPPIELLRQLITYKGFYGRVKPFWTQVLDTNVIIAAAPPGGGRNILSPRFTHLFSIYSIPEPSEEHLRYIFENILLGFLQACSFSDPVRKMGSIAVDCSIDLYLNITKSLKPTPSKFHYIYNLRDVSKMFQSMLMTTPKTIFAAETFTRLWIHECMRTFGDRLVANEDRDWLKSYIISLINNKFHYDWSYEDMFTKRNIIFTDILRSDLDVHERPYEEVLDTKRLAKSLYDMLLEYNSKNLNNKMDLVFFEDAMCYISRITRTLRQKRGNCLLIGVSGCGKESYTTLSSFILKARFFKIRMTKNYRRETFKDEIKTLMKETGIDGKQVCFMLNDEQLNNELFLEDINSILNTGEINNLHKTEEIDMIMQNMVSIMQQLKRDQTKEAKMSTFIERVRDNLHIVLSMSPVGESFRSRCRKFPSFINCSTLIYFDKWPEYALKSVCMKILGDLGYLDKIIQTSLTSIFPQIHLSVEEMSLTFYEELRRKFYVTPKSYIDAIKFFASSLEETKSKYRDNIERLAKGLKNFHSATKMVSQLKIELTKLAPIIEENAKQAAVALELQEIEGRKVAAEDAKIEAEKSILFEQKSRIEYSREEAKKELDAVQPLLDNATKELDTINPADISKIRTYPRPPKMVITIMQAVLIILGNDRKDLKLDWNAAKAELIQGEGFIVHLKKVDYMSLSEQTIKALRGYTINFDPSEVKQVDRASVSLANWCVAIQKCYEAYQKVAPQQEKLRLIEKDYDEKAEEVRIMEEALNIVKKKLRQLEEEHRKLSEEARVLTEKKNTISFQLTNAEKLISLLGSEGERWTQSIAKLKEEEKEIVGNIFLSAASISYIGPFTMKYRTQLLELWKSLCQKEKLNFSGDYSIIRTLGNPMEMKQWNLQGLPMDNISMENGILATKTRRWPLMIDPEGQANKWIKNLEKANELTIVKMTTEGNECNKMMDRCVQRGKPLLLEDVGQKFDSSLYTILGRKTFKSEVEERINFGDKDIPYDPHFRLYLTTKQANPHYMPEICIMLSIINFAVTFDALEEQLLVEVITKEMPEMEKERTKRISEIASYQAKLRDIENEILSKLTNTNEETILNSVDLIQSLEHSKISSKEIETNIKESTVIEQQITKAREQYRSVATRGAILYFVLVDIGKIDPMYQYSFNFLKKLFIDGLNIKDETKVEDESARIEAKKQLMKQNITKVLYRNVCRGLFEIHKLVFSFLITTQINLREGKIITDEWDIFIRGAGVVISKEEGAAMINPLPKLISDSAWNIARAIETKIEAFRGILSSLASMPLQWTDYAGLKNPYVEKSKLPVPFAGDKLTAFQRLILMKILKPECVRASAMKYVEEELGTAYVENPSVKIEELFADSTNKTPIILVLSQGADPTEQLKNYTIANKIDLIITSLGKEQEAKAKKELTEAKVSGKWLLLQNCHLAKSFMPELESMVGHFEDEEQPIHAGFRLLLSSMPVEYFPISVLQNGLKYTTEPPAGIKANITRSYCEMRDFDECKKPREWKLLLYGLALFHAVVQERRKFGPLGWNIRYEFNSTDLDTSKTMLKDFLEIQENLSWDALCFIIGQINYGGRVTDDWDRKLLIALYDHFINPKMVEKSSSRYVFASGYQLPEFEKLEEYQKFIENEVIETDDPEIFGMHENANIAYETMRSEMMLNDLVRIQPRVKPKSAGVSNDDQVLELLKKLRESLPNLLEKEKGLRELFHMSETHIMNSLSTVLLHEIDKYNKLIFIVSSTLQSLEKAVKGEVVMSQELDDMYTNLLMYKVPSKWKIYDSMKPLGSWYPDFLSRVAFIRSWLMEGEPRIFPLSSFVFPQGFLTGALQAHARSEKIPIDALSFSFEILNSETAKTVIAAEKGKLGVYICGLFLEGAAWDEKAMTLVDFPKGKLNMKMPIIHFIPCENKQKPESCYECPVYKTPARQGVLSTTGLSSNFVLAIDIPCTDNASFWTLRGTALICELID